MNLRCVYISVLILLVSSSVFCQVGFHLTGNKKKDRLHFRLVNNLPVVEVEINGTQLSFILDTGAKSSILFSLETIDSIDLKNLSQIKIHGLGTGGSVDALKSLGNTMKVGKAVDANHSLFVIFDSGLNFSPRMGIPIHGILGNDFFENFIVEINYSRELIKMFNVETYKFRKCRKCQELDLEFDGGKPYLNLNIISKNGLEQEAVLLLDSGSSDALWLFEEEHFIDESPKNYFKDYLGLGLGGDIFGKRTRIPGLKVGKLQLENVNTSIPEEKSIIRAKSYEDRDGSVGGGFLKRFKVILDYRNKRIRLKKNRIFKEPFHYDMSGLTIEHTGVELVRKERQTPVNIETYNPSENKIKSSIPIITEMQLSLVPRYVIVNVRNGSPAEMAGVEVGDKVLSVNGKKSEDQKLYQLIEFFSNKEGRKITLEIERDGKKQKIKFLLKSVF